MTGKIWRKILKITAWVMFGFILLIVGILIGTVRILTPERLTPMTNEVANRILNADVSMGKVELSLRHSFPFLNLDVDDMVILSRDIRKLPTEVRDTLPEWGDTLLCAEHLKGGINVFRLALGTIDLNDLEIVGPQANILIVNDSLNNFSIVIPTEEESDTTVVEMPDIRLKSFKLISPKPLRYSDMAQDMQAAATIRSAMLTGDYDDKNALPQYVIDFDSNVSSPLLEIIGQKSMPMGFDGTLEWKHDYPLEIVLKDFHFLLSKISGTINTDLDFSQELTVKSFDFDFDPLVVSEVLAMVHDSLASIYDIPKDIETDARLCFSGVLDRAFVMGSTELPHATLKFSVPSCYLRWELLDLKDFRLATEATLCGGTPDDIKLDIKEMLLRGPGTELSVKGSVTEMVSDPLFDGEVNGKMDIGSLPSLLTRHLHATLKGRFDANTVMTVRPSMFSRNGFHRLKVAGDVGVDDFFYLADDTLSMYYVHRTDLHFGTNEQMKNHSGALTDSLLAATVKIDSADILVSGLDIRVNKLKLGVGAQNKQASTDTTAIIPMGGGLSASSFSLFSITDSAGLRIRNINGMVSMKRYKDDAHLPLFNVKAALGKVSAGDNHTRFMLSDGSLNCTLAKLPINELSKSRQRVHHLADSISRCHPQLSVDSVYILATEIRRRERHPGHHRVHPEFTKAENEIIDWGTSSSLSKLLLDWDIRGSLGANTARLFTPAFPVRNRMENFNIRFNNDSIALTDVMYKAGNSDFLISGYVTNLKRAFTTKRTYSPLRVNFSMESDMIDVNELSDAFFTGAANREVRIGTEYSDETALEHNLSEVKTDTVSALLIPVNIDAQLHVQADNVAYSDFTLHSLQGTILMYDGALSLHDLKAASDVGSIDLSALYSAPTHSDLDFGFGMKLKGFNIHNFLKLVPAVDTIMPMLRDLSGIINANLALTTKINDNMDFILPTLKAAINIEGDSLTFIDSQTFNKIAKWLLFKDKNKNMIDHVSAEMIVDDGEMRVFPFIFDFDRYRLGIQGYNDFDMNFNYHIAVLKSPIPFKFGINVKGDFDKLKIRFGGAKFNETTPIDRDPIVDKTRVNLIDQFQNVFRRGVRNSDFAKVDISDKPLAVDINLDTDTLTAADSALFREQGLIPDIE